MPISNLEIKKLPKSQMEITGEIPADIFEQAYLEAFAEFSKKIEIPGFRPGHAPERTVLERAGEHAIVERAAQIALEKAYPEIIKESKIDAIGHPQIAITKIARGNPLGFKATTAVLPEISLSDWRALAKIKMSEKIEIFVSDKEVEEAFGYMQKSKNRPQIADEELKNSIRQNLQLDKEMRAKEARRMAALDEVAKKASIEIPDILIEGEKNKMLAELKSSISQFGLKWADYLSHIKKTEEELVAGWNNDAEKRSRYGLILRQIANQEKIEPAPAELDEYVSQIILREPESERSKIDKGRVQDYAYGILRNEKVFQLFEQS
ncbi:MAG: trigger factor [Patescibacteria group bacterium]